MDGWMEEWMDGWMDAGLLPAFYISERHKNRALGQILHSRWMNEKADVEAHTFIHSMFPIVSIMFPIVSI
jgi:hypothetical protein